MCTRVVLTWRYMAAAGRPTVPKAAATAARVSSEFIRAYHSKPTKLTLEAVPSEQQPRPKAQARHRLTEDNFYQARVTTNLSYEQARCICAGDQVVPADAAHLDGADPRLVPHPPHAPQSRSVEVEVDRLRRDVPAGTRPSRSSRP